MYSKATSRTIVLAAATLISYGNKHAMSSLPMLLMKLTWSDCTGALHHFTEMGPHAALASLARAIEELVHEQEGKFIQQQREAIFERRAEGAKGITHAQRIQEWKRKGAIVTYLIEKGFYTFSRHRWLKHYHIESNVFYLWWLSLFHLAA